MKDVLGRLSKHPRKLTGGIYYLSSPCSPTKLSRPPASRVLIDELRSFWFWRPSRMAMEEARRAQWLANNDNNDNGGDGDQISDSAASLAKRPAKCQSGAQIATGSLGSKKGISARHHWPSATASSFLKTSTFKQLAEANHYYSAKMVGAKSSGFVSLAGWRRYLENWRLELALYKE